MNLQNFCQRGGLALLTLSVAGYAGLATLRPAPTLAPALAPPPASAVPPAQAVAAPPADPVIAMAAAAPIASPVPVPVPVMAPVAAPMVAPAGVAPVAASVPVAVPPPLTPPPAVAVNAAVVLPSAAPPARGEPLRMALLARLPSSAAGLASPHPPRHASEGRSHRSLRAIVVNAGGRGERTRPNSHAARAEAAPTENAYPVYARLQSVPVAARGWNYRRVY